jgi:hypothetical protein
MHSLPLATKILQQIQDNVAIGEVVDVGEAFGAGVLMQCSSRPFFTQILHAESTEVYSH